ncbi:hypothetical protein [Vibrio neptunius]|uniref:hypothetical protein n=1 Tax=Vibrio neptunius TaxID=170651 RepID=UPI001C5CA66A|nr:hypothetical protein [Vibrio neptunius]QXX06784.1 hypothetical protein KW548_01150 [Vibrio neptunius]
MFLDLSGYTLSGKTAIIDLMREFDCCSVQDKEFEFGLLRMKDGLFDLENALVKDWSPVRSDSAIRKYSNLVRILSGEYKRYSLKWLFSPSGYNYKELVNKDFLSISNSYIDSLVTEREETYWPFALHDEGGIACMRSKVSYFLNKDKLQTNQRMFLDGSQFYAKTQSYLTDLFNISEHSKVKVLHNSLEPYRARDVGLFFKNGRCIVIDRDPRVIYSTSIGSNYSNFSSVQHFVKHFKFTRSRANVDSEHVLTIGLESLIYNYDEVLDTIKFFLGFSNSQHVNQKRYFDPKLSKKYAEDWKKVISASDAKYIERELEHYCFDF